VVHGACPTILCREGWGTPPMISRRRRGALEDPEVGLPSGMITAKRSLRLSCRRVVSCWLNSTDPKSLQTALTWPFTCGSSKQVAYCLSLRIPNPIYRLPALSFLSPMGVPKAPMTLLLVHFFTNAMPPILLVKIRLCSVKSTTPYERDGHLVP
jgi:hypothetical protein